MVGVQVSPPPQKSVDKKHRWALYTGIAAAVFFCFVSAWTVARVRSFSTPTFDFGIFSQMFHSMKETLLPMTTLERDGALSHFAVHVSPIYYLLLPFYLLVPRPETLQVLQAAILASAVIPLWKLGKHHGLRPALGFGVCVLLLLYPAYAGGTSYDLHENCFLAPLLLWLLYGMDRKSLPLTLISALLTLMVKEDAPVYVAVCGLYLLIRSGLHGEKWGLWVGSGVLAGAICYFLGVTAWLSTDGNGVMIYRYSNFMYDGSNSLLTLIQAVLICPIYAVFQCVDPEKLGFLAMTLGPLLGLPLMTRRFERYLLLIPYVLVNLLSDYTYQHSILFQYTFGSTACMFYLVVVNLEDLGQVRSRLRLLLPALCVSLVCFYTAILPVATPYIQRCIIYQESYDSRRALLNTIPQEASVGASTFYTTCLSGRMELYDIRYSSQAHLLSCEYVVLDLSDEFSYRNYGTEDGSGLANLVALLRDSGFVPESTLDGTLEIWRKK